MNLRSIEEGSGRSKREKRCRNKSLRRFSCVLRGRKSGLLSSGLGEPGEREAAGAREEERDEAEEVEKRHFARAEVFAGEHHEGNREEGADERNERGTRPETDENEDRADDLGEDGKEQRCQMPCSEGIREGVGKRREILDFGSLKAEKRRLSLR